MRARCLSILAGNRPKGDNEVPEDEQHAEYPSHPLNERLEAVEVDVQALRREIEQLKKLQDGANIQVLNVWREIAALRVTTNLSVTRDIIFSQLPSQGHLVTQLFTDAATAKTQIRQSANPFAIANDFVVRWKAILEGAGARLVSY